MENSEENTHADIGALRVNTVKSPTFFFLVLKLAYVDSMVSSSTSSSEEYYRLKHKIKIM